MPDGEPFKIYISEAQKQHVKTLAVRAKRAGKISEFMQALNTIQQQLASNPMVFGDPLFTLRGLNELQVFSRLHSVLHVTFGVDEQGRRVFLRSLNLFPSNLGL